jgi:hypothetical protein
MVEPRNHSQLRSDDRSTGLDIGPTLVGKASLSFYLCILGTLAGPKIANLGASHQGNFPSLRSYPSPCEDNFWLVEVARQPVHL